MFGYFKILEFLLYENGIKSYQNVWYSVFHNLVLKKLEENIFKIVNDSA